MNAVEQMERMLETLRHTGIECAEKANFTAAGKVDSGSKIDFETPTTGGPGGPP